MKYRKNERTGDLFSMAGIGTAYIAELPEKEAVEILKAARKGGINIVDLAAGNRNAIEYVGKAFADDPESMHYQIHFGADYSKGDYGWTTNLETVKKQVAWILETLHLEHIEYGFIHCLDQPEDLLQYEKNGVLDYLLQCREEGKVRHLGLSTHHPEMANTILDRDLVDQIMFSINAAYDLGEGEFSNGSYQERKDFYTRCQNKGVGITAMKPFSGGQLLDVNATPLSEVLSQGQCLRYVWNQPGVLTAVCGLRSISELKNLLEIADHADDPVYQLPQNLHPRDVKAKCVYCSHCHPCPAGLNISMVNQFYDLYLQNDPLAADHYRRLEKHASDCIHCSHCNSRCPFHTEPMERMDEIARVFGC